MKYILLILVLLGASAWYFTKTQSTPCKETGECKPLHVLQDEYNQQEAAKSVEVFKKFLAEEAAEHVTDHFSKKNISQVHTLPGWFIVSTKLDPDKPWMGQVYLVDKTSFFQFNSRDEGTSWINKVDYIATTPDNYAMVILGGGAHVNHVYLLNLTTPGESGSLIYPHDPKGLLNKVDHVGIYSSVTEGFIKGYIQVEQVAAFGERLYTFEVSVTGDGRLHMTFDVPTGELLSAEFIP